MIGRWCRHVAGAVALTLACGGGPSVAHDDQITVVVAAFAGPAAIGLGVANVLKLQLQVRSRSADPARANADPPPFGGGYYQLSAMPATPPQHDAAEHRARVNTAQMTVWGSITEVAAQIVMKAYLSIPAPYPDYRTTSHERWRETLDGHAFVVDLPRRRVDFPLQSLPTEVVTFYTDDLAELRICRTEAMRDCPDRVGRGVRFIARSGELIRVRYPTDRRGFIRIPHVVETAHPLVVSYGAGMMALFRADWENADRYFQAVVNSDEATPRLRSDALLIQAMAHAKQGKHGAEALALTALELNRFDATALRYVVMSRLNRANQDGSPDPAVVEATRTDLAALLERHPNLLDREGTFARTLAAFLADR